MKEHSSEGNLHQIHFNLANKLGNIWIVMEYLLHLKLKKK